MVVHTVSLVLNSIYMLEDLYVVSTNAAGLNCGGNLDPPY